MKSRRSSSSFKKRKVRDSTLTSLVGRRVSGVITKTGPDYVALVVDKIEGMRPSSFPNELVRLSQKHLQKKNIPWKVTTPRSWTLPISHTRVLGPHVSLHSVHEREVGKRVTLSLKRVFVWEQSSRWVGVELEGPLRDKTDWFLHMSCAQSGILNTVE